mmetsp:Transcript_28299/g.38969  ORF Transcript_28299/g.38969 Transcript_28299/m.38969 type:complete len:168 (+) Transcript_28299:1527-2030(+)
MSTFSIFKNHLGAPCPCCLDKLLPGHDLLGFTVYHVYDVSSRSSDENMFQWAVNIQSGSITSDENPPNSKLLHRLKKAPCWKKLFTETRAKHNMIAINETEPLELPFPDGTLIRFVSSKQVFVVDNSMKRAIPNRQVFDSHGFDFDNVKVIADEETYDRYETGPDLS